MIDIRLDYICTSENTKIFKVKLKQIIAIATLFNVSIRFSFLKLDLLLLQCPDNRQRTGLF